MKKISTKMILIVEDNRKTNALITRYFEQEDFKVINAYTGREALKLAKQFKPDFIILDLMLPEINGWEVFREIRKSGDIPILMLTALGEEVNRVSGLRMGADDYVVKPFSPSELVARVNTILRRTITQVEPAEKILFSAGDLVLDIEKQKLTLRGRPVSLTSHEYKLLKTFMQSPGKIFSRSELLGFLYFNDNVEVIDRVIDVHIGKLRRKIEKDLSSPYYIRTFRGLGYEFMEQKGDPK